MNWRFPPGVLRRGMCPEQDGDWPYVQTDEQAPDERVERAFLNPTNPEEERGGKDERWRHLPARDKVSP